MKALLGRWLAFAVLLALLVLLGAHWQRADHWLYERWFVPKQAPPDPDIVLVELPDLEPQDPGSRAFREMLGRTLEALAQRGPRQVAVDIAVMQAGEGLPAVLRGIQALRDANVPVLFGVHPRFEPGALAKEVYRDGGLAGVGHTQLQIGRGLVFFRSVAMQMESGVELAFLPTLLVDGVDAWRLPPYQLVAVPRESPGTFGLSVAGGPQSLPARMVGQTVIVASSERECRQLLDSKVNDERDAGESLCSRPDEARAWTGPELLVWALRHLRQGSAVAMPQPVGEPVWILAAALALAALGLALHLLVLRWAGRHWGPSLLARRLWMVDAGVLLVAVGGLAGAEALLIGLNWVVPPMFPLLALVCSVALCFGHSRGHLAEVLSGLTLHAGDEALKAEVDVFISYSHEPENAAWVEREIVEPLRAMRLPDGRPLRLFFDRGSITVGQDWFRRINLGILGSRCFLCVWSDDYIERDYCRWELNYAFPRAARKDFLFLPVARRTDGSPPGPAYAMYLQARQYIDAASRVDFFDDVRAELQRHLGQGPVSS